MKFKKLLLATVLSVSFLSSGCSILYTVKLDQTSIELVKNGEGVQLIPTVLSNQTSYDQTVTWTVENPAVATVTNGFVVGVGGGQTTVYATANADKSTSAACSVTVLDNYTVENVVLDPSSLTLDLGTTKEAKIKATVIGTSGVSQAVSWSVEPAGVVTVSESGVVTAKASGTAVITATSVADHSKYGQCNVLVQSSTKEVTGVTVEPSNVELDMNGTITQQLSATVTGYVGVSQNVTWSSSDTSVAIVSATGIVKAYKTGTCSIYATSKEDTSKRGESKIVVINSASLVIDPSSADLDVYSKKTISLTAKISGKSQSVTWKTSDSTVASVSSYGTVTAKKAGSCVITATLKSDTSITAQCAISVTDSTPVVTKVTLSQTEMSLDSYNNKTGVLTATVEGKYDFSIKVTWSTNNSSVATVSDGTVTAKSKGTAIITATSTTTTSVKATCTVTVTDSAPVSVSLNKTSADVALSKTLQLTATVEHYKSDSSVTWSSNSTKVTVSSSGLVTVSDTAVPGSTATITATSKEDTTKSATCSINVIEMEVDKWTVMIYMCGANLESESGLASGDISEILSVSNQPDDVNILIQTGGASSWKSTHGITASNNQRWHVENKKLVKDVDKVYSSYTSMGLSSTLKDFVVWGLNTYPADKTGLIFWNHGGGMAGVCYDEKKSDDPLINSEVKSALTSAFSAVDRTDKLEFVGYDACLMQVQDIAEFNSNYFNYMIASEESESGYGWDYDTWVDDLYADKDTTVILKAICDGFISENGGTSSSSNYQTLSYLDLSKMAAYKTAWENFSSALKTKLGSTSVSTFANWVTSNVKTYAKDSEGSNLSFSLFDAKDFINKIYNSSSYNPGSVYTSAVLTAHTSLVKYSTCGKGAGNSYGLCMFFACSSYYSSNYSSMYSTSQTNFTNWRTINSSYGYL